MKELKRMNAIIVTGGKQYKVSEGDVIYIEKLDNEAGDTVKFEQVLAIIDGEKATFGAPAVSYTHLRAHETSAHLVGSEMCIRDRVRRLRSALPLWRVLPWRPRS